MTAKGWKFVKLVFGWRTWVLVFLLLLFAFAGPLDGIIRYANFTSLTKEKLVARADDYIRDRVPGDQLVCLYVVNCEGDRARLELVKHLDAWDFGAAKQRIWKRRFSAFCPGRTANFGIQVIPKTGEQSEIEAIAQARWVFFNDHFIPKHGRFQSGAFSEEPWESCTAQFALGGPHRVTEKANRTGGDPGGSPIGQ